MNKGRAQPTGLLEGWLERAALAQMLGVTIDTLARWESARTGPACIRVGRRVFYRPEVVRDWLISRESGGAPSKARAK